MKNLIIGSIAFCFLSSFWSKSNAEDIGRTVIDLDNAKWSLLTSYVGVMKFDRFSPMPLQTKVFQLKNKTDDVIALLSITSTEGGRGSKIKWISETCPDAREKYFTNDFGSNKQPDTRQCLIVNSAFAPFKFYAPESEVVKALTEKNSKMFQNGYSLRTKYGSPGGTYLSVNLMTAKKFKGLSNASPQASELHSVQQELVAWGESLHQGVKDSILSLRGTLELPAIEFEE